MFSERYVRHFQQPHGQGSLAEATHAGEATDPGCGDELALDLVVGEGHVVAARFRVRGCSGAIAAGSALVTLLPGRPARPDAVTREDLEEELDGVPSGKRHALRLACHALAAALQGHNSTT